MTVAGPTTRQTLYAGSLSLVLDGIDLRYLRVGETEVVRRIYAAVRDHNWVTVPASVESLEVRSTDGGFIVDLTARHVDHDIDFWWRGKVEGHPDGAVSYELRGRANASFRYNRIGLCVLYPTNTCAGEAFRGRSHDGTVTGTLPLEVGRQRFERGLYVALSPPLSELEVDLTGGGAVRSVFDGDLFEIEDQRNWSDASFKCYSTPLAFGVGHRAIPGQEFVQTVRCEAIGVPVKAREHRPVPTLSVGGRVGTFPALGSCLPAHDEQPTDDQITLLRELELAHVRCDLRLADPAHLQEASRATWWSERLGCPLELAVHAGPEDGAALAALATALAPTPVARVLLFDAAARSATPTETTSSDLAVLARQHLKSFAPIFGGTDMNLAELNRTRPDIGILDGLSFPIAAEVHAFDDLSILETPLTHADAVRTVAAFADRLPIAVSPVTLRPRFNAVAVEEVELARDALPGSVDGRQRKPLAAAFLAASIAGVAAGGAASATYFQLTGWEGLMEKVGGSPLPQLFPSVPGEVFPAYQVLAMVAGWRGADVLACSSSDALLLRGFALRDRGGRRLLVAANLQDRPARVRAETEDGAVADLELAAHAVESREI